MIRHALRYPVWMSVTTVLVLVATGAELATPWFLKQVVDGVATLPIDNASVGHMLPAMLGFAGFSALYWLAWRVYGFAAATFQTRAMKDADVSNFSYLIGHSHQFFGDAFTGSLVRRISRFNRAFEVLVDEMELRALPATVILTGTIVTMWFVKPILAIGFSVWVMIVIALQVLASRWKLQLDEKRATLDSRVTGILSDTITNALTIKLFAQSKQEIGSVEAAEEELRDVRRRAWFRGEVIFATQGFFMIGIEVAFLFISVNLWSQGQLTVGDLVLLQTYLGLVFHRLWEIGRTFRHVYESIADASEMVEILETPYSVQDIRSAKPLKVTHGGIVFQDVTFSFHQTRTVLNKLSLAIAPGEKVAFVGPSGAGKSTITKLLLRFYDVDSGKVLVDGQNIAKATQDSVREQIAYVPQEPVLFHRTLRENIAYGNPRASEKEIIAAAKKAHCHEFISQLPEGYASFVGERGVKLSGGERQRIAIARAILKDAPILVLDEATSSLDSESEHLIQDALQVLMKKKTVIVIAHRLSTIMQMDRILVVEDGRITDVGTHQELLTRGGTYQRLWDIQAGGFLQED
jgi:ATP-binding cassette subfamily B protein